MTVFEKVGIVGAGMMGAEIALSFAIAGMDVTIKDTDLSLAEMGKKKAEGALDKAVLKGRLAAGETASILSRIHPSENYNDLEGVDLVVEAVFESTEIKKAVFSDLDRYCKPTCIFASNTSSIPITLLATSVGRERRGQFLGAHFFSPASVMKLVEVIPGLETAEEVVDRVMACCRTIGKTPIRVKDVTGFVVNRLLHVMWIEANRLLEEGVATPEDIDLACKLGLGHPIGPYALMDLTGNDLNLNVQKVLQDSYGERFRPRPILRQKVDACHIGRKTGRGWYGYEK